ncbi:MAG: LPS export ABC transporter periplasmic protein LptC [Bacteroidia bacterium]|nr:LPS export ABC transporter periplasmic protein LptC [Bacteroidia bacterium]
MKFSFLFLISTALFFSSCENDIEKINMVSRVDDTPLERAENIDVLYSDSGFVKMKLTAPVLERYMDSKDPYMLFPKGMKTLFYDRLLNITSRLSAEYGIRYENSQRMEARKNVEVINEKGDKLNTEHLTYDQADGKLRSDEFVKITTEDEIIYGTGLEANEDFSRYRIFNIKGIINLKK